VDAGRLHYVGLYAVNDPSCYI